MNKFAKSFRRGEKGFTLIELLIVIVILGILSAVAIPQVTKFIRQGKVAAANSEVALINVAVGAGMADAQVVSVTSAGISPTLDFVISATSPGFFAGDYIQGSSGVRSATLGYASLPLTGTYTIATNGTVSACSAGWTDLTFSGGKFQP